MVVLFISWIIFCLCTDAQGILIGTDTCIYSSTGDKKITINDYCGRDLGVIEVDNPPVDAALWNHWLIVTLDVNGAGIPVIDTCTQKVDHYLPFNHATALTIHGDTAYIAHPAGKIYAMNLKDNTTNEFLTVGCGVQFLSYRGPYLLVGTKRKILVYEMRSTPSLHDVLIEDYDITHILHMGQELRYVYCKNAATNDYGSVAYNLVTKKEISKKNLVIPNDPLAIYYMLLGVNEVEKSYIENSSGEEPALMVALNFLSHFDWILSQIPAETLDAKGDGERTKAMLERKESKLSLNGIESCAFILGLEQDKRDKVLGSSLWKTHKLKLLRNLVLGVFISEKYCQGVLTGLLQLGDPQVTEAWKIRSGSTTAFAAYPVVLTIPAPAISSTKQHTD